MAEPRWDIQTTLMLLSGLAVAFLLAPVLILVPMSLNGGSALDFPPKTWSLAPYANIANAPKWRSALATSAEVASLVAILTPMIALPAAYAFQRGAASLRPWLILAASLPLFVPPVILAVGQLLVAAPVGLVDTVPALVIGHTLLAFPVAFFVLNTSLAKADLGLEHAAEILGAPWPYAFLRVTWPQVRAAAAVAAALSFVVSFDEPVIALFLTSTNARTLPRQMFDSLRYDIDPTAAAVSAGLIVVSVAAAMLVRQSDD